MLEKENENLKKKLSEYENKTRKKINEYDKELNNEKNKNKQITNEYEKTIKELENKLKLLNESHNKYIEELKDYYDKELESRITPDKLEKIIEYRCNGIEEEIYNNNKIYIERLKDSYESKLKEIKDKDKEIQINKSTLKPIILTPKSQDNFVNNISV